MSEPFVADSLINAYSHEGDYESIALRPVADRVAEIRIDRDGDDVRVGIYLDPDEIWGFDAPVSFVTFHGDGRVTGTIHPGVRER